MNSPPNVIDRIVPTSFLRSQIRDGTAQLEIIGRRFDNAMNSVVFAGVGRIDNGNAVDAVPCQTNTRTRLIVTVPANAITGEIFVDTRSIVSLPVLLTIVEDVVEPPPVNVSPVNVPPVNVPPVLTLMQV